MNWSIRSLLSPVITRCHIYGVNAIDLEFVLKQVEKKPMINSRAMESAWSDEWENKANRFINFAQIAESKGNRKSAYGYYSLATKCYYAIYLMNSNSVEYKKDTYKKLEKYYKKSITYSEYSFEELNIKLLDNKILPAYLHLPSDEKSEKGFPCVIVCAGMGSCKEELETLTRPLVERGMAVLACDLPGTGSALFDYDVKMTGENLEIAFGQIIKTLKEHPLIDGDRLGTTGVCMGGGYAYRIASQYKEVKACVSLFPLYINMVGKNAVPRWMKQGTWADYQFGIADSDSFINEMAILSEGYVDSNFLLVCSDLDNWMGAEQTELIFEKTKGVKERILLEEDLAFETKESVMHAMPVGEQMHWIKIYASDWMGEKLK